MSGDLKAPEKSVIEGYLNGNSYEKISKQNQISKGTVFNIIKGWKDRIAVPDIDSIREFSVFVTKSGLTLDQCVQGVRFIKILSSFGISDELDIGQALYSDDNTHFIYTRLEENAGITDDESAGKKSGRDAATRRDSFYHFVGNLYDNCKIHHIDPAIIVRWMDDLLEFGFSTFNSNTIESNADGTPIEDATNFPKNSIVRIKRNQISLISKIDNYLEKEKLEFQRLQQARIKLSRDIKRAIQHKNTLVSNLEKTMIKERNIMRYYSWYKSLMQELEYEYGIDIGEEFGSFARAIVDFKAYNYNVLDIIKDYKQIESLREEKEKVQSKIDLITHKRDILLEEIDSLQENLSYSTQSLNTYKELLERGLGLKELKQLLNTLIEISRANKIADWEALPRFLNDVEKQYDNKLGFESTLNNLKAKMEKLQAEVPEYKWYLKLQGVVSPTIIHLNRCGVTNEDILNINSLVLSFKNSNFIDDLALRENGNGVIKNDILNRNE